MAPLRYLIDANAPSANTGDNAVVKINPDAKLLIKSAIIFDANPEIEVVFQSDKDVTFDSVAKAMAAVQSVCISKIGIVTTGYGN